MEPSAYVLPLHSYLAAMSDVLIQMTTMALEVAAFAALGVLVIMTFNDWD